MPEEPQPVDPQPAPPYGTADAMERHAIANANPPQPTPVSSPDPYLADPPPHYGTADSMERHAIAAATPPPPPFTGSADGVERQVEALEDKISTGDFLLDPDGLAKVYSAYYSCWEGINTLSEELASSAVGVPWNIAAPNPGALIDGVMEMDGKCHSAADYLSAQLVSLGGRLTQLMNGFQEVVNSTSQADADSGQTFAQIREGSGGGGGGRALLQ